jgi:hypothetical protein
MRERIGFFLGTALVVNGVWMLLVPSTWYQAVPGVSETGPMNFHFVRDIGCGYVASGLGLIMGRGRASSALFAAVFLGLHACVHVADTLSGAEPPWGLARDAFGVGLPALLALAVAWPQGGMAGPLDLWARRRMASFEREFGYDMTYMRKILELSPGAFWRFAPVSFLAAHREDVPLEAFYASKIEAARSEDCGPCTQLVVTQAEKTGVSPRVLRGILTGDDSSMGSDARLGAAFARAVLRRDVPGELRSEVQARFGPRGLVSLSLAIAASRVFPCVKHAMGFGEACTRVRVAGDPVPLDAWSS